ncbi:MAG: hypothetical protein ACR2QW_04615, partial [bacterium]
PWAVHSNLEFHWRFKNFQNSIKTHSSWRYLNDLDKIQDTISPVSDQAFIADLATSYYVAAETGLVPLVQQAHHTTSGLQYKEIFSEFCDGEISEDEFSKKLDRINLKRKKSNSPPVRFIIINKDFLNYTAEVHGSSCVGETEHLLPGLTKISENVFEGEYLSLWELKK